MSKVAISQIPNFRVKTTLGVALTSVLLLSPFALYQLTIEKNIAIGMSSLAIVVIFAINAWNCYRDKYNSQFTFLILAPIIILYLAYAFATVGAISMFWCYPAALSFYFMLPEKRAWFANLVLLLVVIPQAWGVLGFEYAIRLLVSLSMVIVFSGVFVRVISGQQARLESLALYDSLTGLLNRTSLHETLEHAITQNRRLGIPITLLGLDLDYFKSINDRYGHDAGDAVLRDIGKYLHGRIRQSDKVFRLGGEEFLIVLYDTDAGSAMDVAEELRAGIASLTALPDHELSASIGLATLKPDESWDEWMKRCDDKLYSAKSSGRNLVIA